MTIEIYIIMNIVIGLLIIAIGAFCQSSSYVPINKIRNWSWESYWLVQGVFAWLIFPFLGALLAVPAGHSLFELYASAPQSTLLAMLFGVLWGVGGLTFGLSMRYLGVALGQSIALGTCAGLGTIMGPVLLHMFFPSMGALSSLTSSVIIGVIVTLIGIAIIGVAGGMKSASLSEEDKKEAVKDFNFLKGLAIALLAGFMSGCFNVGLEFGKDLNFGELTHSMFRTLPATLLVTAGGFLTNAVYCLYQNSRNRTFSDYADGKLWASNIFFCALAGLLWYSLYLESFYVVSLPAVHAEVEVLKLLKCLLCVNSEFGITLFCDFVCLMYQCFFHDCIMLNASKSTINSDILSVYI